MICALFSRTVSGSQGLMGLLVAYSEGVRWKERGQGQVCDCTGFFSHGSQGRTCCVLEVLCTYCTLQSASFGFQQTMLLMPRPLRECSHSLHKGLSV